ncbi:MAG: 4-alpha-glucanotransferase [Candidatus Bipolaricaulaceae bacterium]
MELPRSFGVLLHPTSLPGPWVCGVLGREAREFLGWLAEAGARFWQVLPLGPTGFGDSPYQSFSAFAGNPYLIDPEDLFARGWLPREEPPVVAENRVDYGLLYRWKWDLLRRAFWGFQKGGDPGEHRDFARFWEREARWLWDYALFMALKDRFAGRPWNEWPREFRLRAPKALATMEEDENVRFHAWTQWVFFREWEELRNYAHSRGIKIIGDIPIFVAYDSADVWAHPELFELDEEGRPTVVAGVPPDYFSPTGQRWGNPLYRWPAHAAEGFRWWIARVQQTLRLCDLLRIDHFRGFSAYWEIPAEEPTAVRGRWVPAPGEKLFTRMRAELGELPILAEDLGVITPDVEELRDKFGFPGMRVLQFAFDGKPDNPHLPENFPEHGRVVVYPGTHDNDTALGWFRSLGKEERERVLSYLAKAGIAARGEAEIPWALLTLAFLSRAKLAVIPVPDILGLGSEARMNYPSRPEGNWTWRLAERLDLALAEHLLNLAREKNRIPKEV